MHTLQKKAAFYERHLEEWGQKRLGLVHKLEWDAKSLRAKNCPEADEFIQHRYREGWKL